MMAGMAYRSSPNTSGLLAMVIAWAAFCIPISMTIVRRSWVLRRIDRDSTTPLAIASNIRTVMERPSWPKLAIIASRFLMKNTVARKISAGKAIFESTLWIFSAAPPHFFLTAMPTMIGTSISTMFCTTRLPTGRCTSTVLLAAVVTHSKMRGTVNSVMILLHAVSDTESATSPLASIENTFDELPPGQHAISTKPIRKTGSRCSAHPISHASAGSTTICPIKPASTGLGRSLNNLKSCNLRFNPNSNISSVRMGITIKIVAFIFVYRYSFIVFCHS